MPPSENILIVVAALIVSGQTLPPDIGRSSFKYDPNSIVQNERILRLFLRLASYTANHLIHLKNEARQRDVSNLRTDAGVPVLRINLPGKVSEERLSGRRYYGQSGRHGYDYGRDPHTTPYREASPNRYVLRNEYPLQINGPYIPATEDSLSSLNIYGRHKDSYILTRRENVQVPLNNPTNNVEKSVDIENRILFNGEKNNNVTHYKNNSRDTTNANARINNVASSFQQRTAPNAVQSGPVNQNAKSLGFHGSEDESTDNRANTLVNNLGSGSELSSQNDGALSNKSVNDTSKVHSGLQSGIQSGDTAIVRPTMIAASNLKASAGFAGIAGQAMTTASNLQSESTRLINSGGISGKAMTAASNLQSESTRLINSRGFSGKAMTAPSNLPSGSTGLINSGGVAHEAMTATSQLQSGSSGLTDSKGVAGEVINTVSNLRPESVGLINSVQTVASDSQSAGTGNTGQVMITISNLQSGSTRLINSGGIADKTITATSNLQSESTRSINSGGMADKTITATSNLQSESTGSINSGGMADKTITAASNLQSESTRLINSGGIADKTITAASNLQSDSTGSINSGGIADKTITAASNLQSESTGLINSGGVANEAMIAASNLQSGSPGLIDSKGVAGEDMNTASNLRSGSAGPLNLVQSVASDNQSAGKRIAGEAMTAGSNLQSGSTRLINSGQDTASDLKNEGPSIQSPSLKQLAAVTNSESKTLMKTMTTVNENQASLTMTSQPGSPGYQSTAENTIGIGNSSQSGGIVLNADPTKPLTNQGSSLVYPSKAIHAIRNVDTGTSGATTKVATIGGTKVLQGMQNATMSLTRESPEGISQLLGPLTGIESKFPGSSTLQPGVGTERAAIETSHQRGNSAPPRMIPKGSGITQVGSSLIETVPVFTPFPDIKDQSLILGNAPTDVKERLKIVPNKIIENSSADDGNGVKHETFDGKYAMYGEDGVSEVELQEYANKFADALRPIRVMS